MTKYDDLVNDYQMAIDVIATYFDISKSELLVKNTENVVDARYCLIYILCEKYKDADIAKVCNISKSVVNKIRNQVNAKMRNKFFYYDLNKVKMLLC